MKTNAEIQADFRKRKVQSGLKEVRGIWLEPDQHETLKAASLAIAAGYQKRFFKGLVKEARELHKNRAS
tara:strand:- start:417 stop:623 length:207 start_codon:yes stop_codon:yes gene_type:complete